VKTGRFDALGCGGNPESWTEIFVQLWDIDEDGRTHMSSRADRRWPRDCGARSSPGKLQASRPLAGGAGPDIVIALRDDVGLLRVTAGLDSYQSSQRS